MKLIVLLVAIIAKKINIAPSWLYDDKWFIHYFDKLKTFSFFDNGSRPLQMLLVCVPIVTLVGLVYWFLGGFLFGLIGFVIAVLVVQFAFGARDLTDELGEYLLFWRANNKDHYRQTAKKYFALGSWGVSDEAMHKAVFGEVLQRSCYYLFTPLFWFWVFGPIGAVACGLCSLISRQRHQDGQDSGKPRATELALFAQDLQETIAWLPARMMVLSFSVTGHFSNVIKPALETFTSVESATYDVLNDCAADALSLSPLVEDKDQMREQADTQMIGLQSLLNRTLGLWLVAIAMFTIFGFNT